MTRWLLALMFLLVVGCGGSPDEDSGSNSQAIVNGTLDGDAHPYVGALVAHVDGAPFRLVCSGTLIHPEAFLTAGHCTFLLQNAIAAGFISLSNVAVTFSPDAFSGDALAPAISLHTIPSFVGQTNTTEDVGVVVLDEADTAGISSVALPPLGFLDSAAITNPTGSARATFTTVGYGAQAAFPPGVYPTDGLRRHAFSEFRNLDGPNALYLATSTVSTPAQQGGGGCVLDSGGPNLIDHGGETYVAGVLFAADAKCTALNFSTRTDVSSVAAFVAGVIGE